MNNSTQILGLIYIGYIISQTMKKDTKRNIENEDIIRNDKTFNDEDYKTYSNSTYGIEFKYPANWNKNPEYIERYDGENGFFEISDLKAPGENIDQVIYQDINSPLKPYGNSPQIRKLTVDGQPARLIIPSKDQEAIFQNEYGVVIQYKKPITIDNQEYQFIEIWADKDHIGEIIDSFRFI